MKRSKKRRIDRAVRATQEALKNPPPKPEETDITPYSMWDVMPDGFTRMFHRNPGYRMVIQSIGRTR